MTNVPTPHPFSFMHHSFREYHVAIGICTKHYKPPLLDTTLSVDHASTLGDLFTHQPPQRHLLVSLRTYSMEVPL